MEVEEEVKKIKKHRTTPIKPEFFYFIHKHDPKKL